MHPPSARLPQCLSVAPTQAQHPTEPLPVSLFSSYFPLRRRLRGCHAPVTQEPAHLPVYLWMFYFPSDGIRLLSAHECVHPQAAIQPFSQCHPLPALARMCVTRPVGPCLSVPQSTPHSLFSHGCVRCCLAVLFFFTWLFIRPPSLQSFGPNARSPTGSHAPTPNTTAALQAAVCPR